MKRALIAAALLAAVAIAAAAPCMAQPVANPVARLEVTKGSKDTLTQHQKLDGIKAQLDQVLDLLKGSPPKPPVVDPQPPKPVDTPNPFVAWREQGLSLVDVAVWRLGRGLTDAELEQAHAAGYPRPGAATAPAGPAAASRDTFVLSQANGYLVHPRVTPGQPYTFTFPEGVGTIISVFPVGGDEITHVNGVYSPSGGRYPAIGSSIALTVQGNGRDGLIWLGVQLLP